MKDLLTTAKTAQQQLRRFEELGGDIETPTVNYHRERWGDENQHSLAVFTSVLAYLRSIDDVEADLITQGFTTEDQDLDFQKVFFGQTLQATAQYLLEQLPSFPA